MRADELIICVIHGLWQNKFEDNLFSKKCDLNLFYTHKKKNRWERIELY